MGGKGQTASRFCSKQTGDEGTPSLGQGKGRWCSSRSRQKEGIGIPCISGAGRAANRLRCCAGRGRVKLSVSVPVLTRESWGASTRELDGDARSARWVWGDGAGGSSGNVLTMMLVLGGTRKRGKGSSWFTYYWIARHRRRLFLIASRARSHVAVMRHVGSVTETALREGPRIKDTGYTMAREVAGQGSRFRGGGYGCVSRFLQLRGGRGV